MIFVSIYFYSNGLLSALPFDTLFIHRPERERAPLVPLSPPSDRSIKSHLPSRFSRGELSVFSSRLDLMIFSTSFEKDSAGRRTPLYLYRVFHEACIILRERSYKRLEPDLSSVKVWSSNVWKIYILLLQRCESFIYLSDVVSYSNFRFLFLNI